MPPVDAAGGAGAAPPVDVAPAITASASAPATRPLANRLPSPRPIFTLPNSMVGAIVVGAPSSRQHPAPGDPGSSDRPQRGLVIAPVSAPWTSLAYLPSTPDG